MRLNVGVSVSPESDKKGIILGISSVSENEIVKAGREVSEMWRHFSRIPASLYSVFALYSVLFQMEKKIK